MPRRAVVATLIVLAASISTHAADIRYLDGHSESVRAVSVSPKHDYLVSVGDDSRIVIRPIRDLSKKKTSLPRQGGLMCIAFTKNGKHLLASGNLADFSRKTEIDGILKIDLESLKHSFIELPVRGTILRMAIIKGDRQVAYFCASKELIRFDIGRKEIVAKHRIFGGFVGTTAISPKAQHFAATSQNEKNRRSAEPCKLTAMRADGTVTVSYEFSSAREYDGSQLCFTGENSLILCLPSGSLLKWKWNAKRKRWKPSGKALSIPKGRFSAIAWDEGRNSLWLARNKSLLQIDIRTGKLNTEIRVQPGKQKGEIFATPILCITPQPQRVFAGLWDGRIAVVPLPAK